jgi:hypothetical protein
VEQRPQNLSLLQVDLWEESSSVLHRVRRKSMKVNTKPCPHCDREIAVRCLSQHVKSCIKMPDPKTFAQVAPTLTVTEMIAAWGVTKSAIWSRLKRTGVKAKPYTRYAPPTTFERERVISLYHQNVSLRVIADDLGVSIRKVDSVVRKGIRTGDIVRRKRIYNLAAKYKKCCKCGIRLDGFDVPSGHENHCGFCVGGAPLIDIIRYGDMNGLAAELLDTAVRDAINKRFLHHEMARAWLSSDMADWWIDASGADYDFAREQIKKALGGQRVISNRIGDWLYCRGSIDERVGHHKNERPKSGGGRSP